MNLHVVENTNICTKIMNARIQFRASSVAHNNEARQSHECKQGEGLNQIIKIKIQ